MTADKPAEFYEEIVSEYTRLVMEYASRQAKRKAMQVISRDRDVTRERIGQHLQSAYEMGLTAHPPVKAWPEVRR